MPDRQRSGRRSGRRRGNADDGPDLFAQTLAKAVEQGFATATQEEQHASPSQTDSGAEGTTVVTGRAAPAPPSPSDPVPGISAGTGDGAQDQASEPDRPAELLPARMLNEFVYCPQLFYYEHVEGVFVENADTVRGEALHQRVDQGNGALAKPASGDTGVKAGAAQAEATTGENEKAEGEEKPDSKGKKNGKSSRGTKETEGTETIHSKSVMLGSERLGAIAKMDLVEAEVSEEGHAVLVCPVDYKAGSPREDDDGHGIWDTDRMQLGLQALILRENGYPCEEGVIYYRGTKQRVRLPITPELEAWVLAQIDAARITARGPIPLPLIDSPKCVRCSLAPVCLPDETRMLSSCTPESPEDAVPAIPGGKTPRAIHAPRDERRPLYLNTQGARIGCADEVLKVKEKDRLLEEVRARDVCHVALFGNIQISTQALRLLSEMEVPVTYFSTSGWFYAITRGHSLKNVFLRIEQFRHASDPAACLRLARQFVLGKIHNHRVLFMRNHVEPPDPVKLRLARARIDAVEADSLERLLGIEGAAAALYFEHFDGLLRNRSDPVEAVASQPDADGEERLRTFDFRTRNRRPPTDPVNALLSLAYSLLAKECTIAAHAVGFDPYIGFYHQPRFGRPALALDVMEEFRPIIAESAVVTAINNRFISINDFVTAGRAVNLNQTGRRQFFQCFEQRMNALITHPVFDYKVSYRRAIELQFRILARVLTGEIPEYTPFTTR